MTHTGVHVGCDVAKHWIDVAILEHGTCFRVSNDKAGWTALRRRLAGGCVSAVGVEATGGYERGLILALLAADQPVRRVNPYRLRRFAQAMGLRAKNDRIDAQTIARFTATVALPPVAHDPAVDQLAELVHARQQLTQDLTRLKNQADHARSSLVKDLAARRIAALRHDIKHLDKHIAQAVSDTPDLAHKDRLLQSVRGVGPVVSHSLIAFMPELGHISPKQAASLLGVAPFDHDSGKLKGQRCIAGGRRRLRNVAYMAALAAARYNPTLRTFYQRLKAKGKKPKLAIVAVMRKLITILNAILRDKKPWSPNLVP